MKLKLSLKPKIPFQIRGNLNLVLFVLTVCLMTTVGTYAQIRDSIVPIRDNIGDLNEAAIRKGEFPGAIKLPGSGVSLAIGGFIKAVAFYDTQYNVKNEIIVPGTFSEANIDNGQTYIGARSSRLYFDGRSTIKDVTVRGYLEMDFRGGSGFTLRHAYLTLTNKANQSLLMGQYWSLIMDLQSIPEGLVEPTVSGGAFARQGQIRFTTPLSKSVTFAASIEEPNSSDLKGENIAPVNKYPDLIGSFSYDPVSFFHFSVAGLYRSLSFTDATTNKLKTKSGWLTSASMVVKPNETNKFTISGIYGSGAGDYIMGTDGTSAYYDQGNMELQVEYGGTTSYRHIWNDKFRSNIAFGIFKADRIKNNPNAHIKSSTYGFINTYYHMNKYVNIGIEWVYTDKQNYLGENFNNNRFQFGIQVF